MQAQARLLNLYCVLLDRENSNFRNIHMSILTSSLVFLVLRTFRKSRPVFLVSSYFLLKSSCLPSFFLVLLTSSYFLKVVSVFLVSS